MIFRFVYEVRTLAGILVIGALVGLIFYAGMQHGPPAPCRTGVTVACVPAFNDREVLIPRQGTAR